MSGKTLSTGTLSLRFMQNAHRAKQLKEVEADKAQVKDDGEWEVTQDLKDTWSTGSGSQSSQSVTYETSYLPFIFPPLLDTSESPSSSSEVISKPKGRRAFNKKGQEVSEEKRSEVTPMPSNVDTLASGDTPKGSKAPGRPVSISGSSSNLQGFSNLKKQKGSKTAKQAIYDNSGVGIDLRPAPPMRPTTAANPLPNVFLKPSRVDDPADTPSVPSNDTRNDANVIHGARDKVKVKRERESAPEQLEGEGKRRKKKRKNAD